MRWSRDFTRIESYDYSFNRHGPASTVCSIRYQKSLARCIQKEKEFFYA